MISARVWTWLGALAFAGVMLVLTVACTAIETQMTLSTPAWACPSPTPLPYGMAGPVKEVIHHPRPTITPSGPVTYDDERVYYEVWEREYGDTFSGPPFPSPTAYVREGNTFSLGQWVRIDPLFANIDARASTVITDGRQLYLVEIAWRNPTVSPISVDYAAQIQLLSVRRADGTATAGDGWFVSPESLRLAATGALPTVIPVGDSTTTIPILAPPGGPGAVALLLRRDGSYLPAYPTPTGTPVAPATATPVVPPTPNTDLRRTDSDVVMVVFTAEQPANPVCDSPGMSSAWSADGSRAEGRADVPIVAPAGAGRLVELSLAQIGKRYVWGTAGPSTFDCSGLVVWLYGQIGLPVPARTADDQFRTMRPVDAAHALPGDPMYFRPAGSTRITHAAVYVGDINGDGVGDVVHAASPRYGVLLLSGGVRNSYYFGPTCTLCFAGYRTMR
ncbi:C40 family peptidase [Oscillochloris sp. ZM17-4]|uniref:C40 family peptidase n=1 Tax=Oscillochloris sp. ZM17-4 TaxID=2866714 RepID=UPI001C736BE9|nr:C40 family peptidase [Oscillochloris sp. ZM17-4]MBX0331124.1 C40 family peptidase [Oscillochloris sp. ZM17-4]